MGKIRKQGNRWIVDFRIPRALARKYGVKRFRRSFSKLATAKRMHALVSSAIELRDPEGILGKILGKGETEYTVSTFYSRWIEEYCRPRLEPTTVTRYELSFKTILAFQGELPLGEYRRQHLHGYIQHRSNQVSVSTINKDIIAIKKMLSYAYEVGAVEANSLTRFPTLKVQEKAIRIPTPSEFELLIESMPDKALAAMVTVLGECGLRRSEAINMQWPHVDYAREVLVLERTKGKRVRHVPLTPRAIEALRSLQRFVHTQYVFVHQLTGERWVSPDKAFRAGRKKAGLPWVTIHMLRHMRATRWLDEGVPLIQVKKWLGHRDIQTTMKYEHYVSRSGTKAGRLEGESL